MKKFPIFLIVSAFITISAIVQNEKFSYYKIFKIQSPTEIWLDYNKNFIFDEKQPFILNNIYSISSYNTLQNNFLDNNELFLLSYFEKEISENALKNKFVKIKNNDLIIQGKSYKNILLSSGLFFEKFDKNKIQEIIKKYNYKDYYIYNSRSNVYHELTCKTGKLSKNYRIIKKSNIGENAKACGYCIAKKRSLQSSIPYISRDKENKNNINFYNNDLLKIYVINLNSIYKPSKKCNTKACLALKQEIDNAKNNIDFAIYGLNSQPEIVLALINAKNRGVQIRWVCDYEKKEIKYYPDVELLKKHLPKFKTNKENKSGIMHNKFFIFDNEKVWTGSANITSTDLTGFNANYALLLNSPEIAQIYKNEFEQMYNGNFSINKKVLSKNSITKNNTSITVLFSPQDKIIRHKLIPIINNAKKYIYIPTFFITDKKILNALIDAKHRGIDIKIINDATNSHSKYSIHNSLRKAGIQVKTENYAGKMHSKSLIIDDTISIIGSMNLTYSGENKNDENVVIIKNEEITKFMKNSFIDTWNKIPDKYKIYDPRAESIESIGSCSDGIDNNFDGKIDLKDEGCKNNLSEKISQ